MVYHNRGLCVLTTKLIKKKNIFMVQANMFIMSFMVYKTQQFSDIKKI